MRQLLTLGALCPAMVGILVTGANQAQAQPWRPDQGGEYRAGDFHNHTTCSDGSTSVRTLTRKSLTYLDWFLQVGHSGSGPRDCRVDDFLYFARASEFGPGLWINTLEDPDTEIKGDYVSSTASNGAELQSMWRWQMLQDYSLNQIVDERELPANDGKIAGLGLEWTVPGHEHISSTVVTGQYDLEDPNADALAQFEYCFGRPSDDTSGGEQGWTCEISEDDNNKLLDLFAGRNNEGTPDYNSTLYSENGEFIGVNTDDSGEHVKSVAAALWMQEHFDMDSFVVQAHVERQGGFVPGSDRGHNVEHMRDSNTLAPNIAFGFESEPGHQAQFNRGSYNISRPTAGFYTYGGTGCYAAAEAALPGHDFDGTPLDPARFQDGGDLEGVPDNVDLERVVLCRPGVRTMWDALLSEGRRFFYFASSDWHSRGSFGPLDYEATGDFWPGEYQQNFTWIEEFSFQRDPAQRIVDGLRSGNGFSVQGQLIDQLSFEACSQGECATMGETLTVRPGARVFVSLTINDPEGLNNCPYAFNNPSLMQIGVERPLNQPEVAMVQFIQGAVTGKIPSHLEDGSVNPDYFNPLAPATTRIVQTFDGQAAKHTMTYSFRAFGDAYIRAYGSNIPAGTPNERDADGNPLPDNLSDNIPCLDADCPAHINGTLNADVEAWADLSFHANPIFVEVLDQHRRHGRHHHHGHRPPHRH